MSGRHCFNSEDFSGENETPLASIGRRDLIDLPGVGIVGDSMSLREIISDVLYLWTINAFTVESAFRDSARIAFERLKRAHLEMR